MEVFTCRKLPITFLRAQLDSDVVEHLQIMPIMSLSEADMSSSSQSVSLGFVRASDNPRNYGHIYFEGYAHAHYAIGAAPAHSMNPRTGTDYEKPAAPPMLLAFFEAMRRVNAKLLTDTARRLDGVAGWAAALLAHLVRSGRAWADLALQTHYGTDEPGVWHSDSANSLLHMAVSVRGVRSLLSMDDDGHTRSCLLPPGSVYLTSPALFPHAVEYANAPSHDERIFAVQARFLTSRDEIEVLEEARRGAPEEWRAVAEAIFAEFEQSNCVKKFNGINWKKSISGDHQCDAFCNRG